MKLFSKIENPSKSFAYNKHEAIKRCMDALQTDRNIIIQSVDPEEGVIHCISDLDGTRIRYSFVETAPDVTEVTAVPYNPSGTPIRVDMFGMFLKRISKPFDKM